MHKCLEKVFILIENVKVSKLGLQLHLGKTKQEKKTKKNRRLVRKHRDGQDLLKGVARFTEPRKTEMHSAINEGTVEKKNDICQEYF